MSENVTTFEVRVRVDTGEKEYKPLCDYVGKNYRRKDEWLEKCIYKMFHIDARTQRQAEEIARRKYGEPVSCRKVDAVSQLVSIEHLDLAQTSIYGSNSPYKNPIAMDEFIWQKRNKRRVNLQKDKNKSL